MADIREITTADSYHGDENLAGGTMGAFQLDTRPLQNLAAYTFSYNKAMYEDEQKKKEAQAKEMADLTAYDLTSAVPDDREVLQKNWGSLYNYVKENLSRGVNVMDYQNHPKEFLEYNKLKQGLNNDITGGKVRSIMYSVRQKEATDATDPDVKAMLQKMLDDEAHSTDIRTPIKHTNQFDLTPTVVKPADRKQIEVTDIGANLIGTKTYDLPDMDSVANQAVAAVHGLTRLQLDTQSDEFKAMTPDQRKNYLDQYKMQQAAGKLEPLEMSKNFNQALLTMSNEKDHSGDFRYRNADGRMDIQKLIDSGNPIVGGIAEQVRIYNDKMDEMVNLIDKGAFKDHLGRELHFGGLGGLSKNSYSKINLDDGVSPEELMKLRILAVTPAAKENLKIQVTKLGMEQERLNLDSWYKRQLAAQGWQKTKAYMDGVQAKIKQLKTVQEQDAVLDEIFKHNLIQQKSLAKFTKEGNLAPSTLRIQADESLPLFTIDDTKKVSRIKPIGAEVIYDRYATDENGKYVKDEKGNKIPAKGAKVIEYKGGYYRQEYYFVNNEGRKVNLTPAALQDKFMQFKQENPKYTGGFDDYLKENIKHDVFDVKIIGENGATDRSFSSYAQRMISNAGTKKGQIAVFDENPETIPADETTSSTEELIIEDKNR